jgi:uncharacterized protein YjbJ (UPF0337 family)
MSWDVIEGNWKQFKGKVKTQWGKLTDDDLEQIEGRREDLAGRIQKRYGLEKAAAHRQIDDWMREPGVLDDWNDARPILDM